jgi:DeoR/GlpR family transcriptional regulator of sugar metabolism
MRHDRVWWWVQENSEIAAKMLSGKFKTKEIGITREIEELHRFGYVKRLPRLAGGRCMWEATKKLREATA